MNIELSTDNLTKVCRICLHMGLVNIRKYKVKLNAIGNQPEDSCDETDLIEVTINEIMQIFNKWEHNVWDLSDELHMVCNQCLDDIVGTYLFYKKLEHANQHIKRLYKAALEIECDASEKESAAENIESLMDDDGDGVEHFGEVLSEVPLEEKLNVCGNVESVRSILECSEAALPSAVADEHVMYEEEEEEQFVEQNEEPPMYAKTAMAPHLPSEFVFSEQFSYAPAMPISHDNEGPVKKRARSECEPTLDNASLLIGQFIPSATLSEYNTDLQADADETCVETKLHTLEYAPIQIKSDEIDIIKNQECLTVGDDSTPPSGRVGDCQSIYMCKYCPHAYSAANYLIAHIQKCHVCLYCMQAFNKDTDLFDHLKLYHKENECKICHKHLSSKSNLRAHMKRVHGLKLPAKVTLMAYRNERQEVNDMEQSDMQQQQITEFDDKFAVDMEECDFINSIIECDLPI